ncbi:MAG: NADH-quinone oxidoreductase subunit NuoE, partial [Geodermatophilaceae bacterium]|nr:NADH-quinone oxidoreductase subunit NuoE [Geodermatophilaceae bacterium]
MSASSKPRDPAGGSHAAHEVLEDSTGGLDPRGTGGGVAVAPGDTDHHDAYPGPRTTPPLTDRARLEARQIITRYPRARSALLPMLHLVQSEQGYITPAGIAFCAEELDLTKAQVAAVATFYTMFKRRPTGEYLVSVCTNTLCGFLGGEEIYHALADHLGVGHDQTTADGQITLEHAECLAACDYAPVVTVNYEFYDQQDTATAMNLVTDLQQGRRPVPTRGAPLVSFREISRELAGFGEPDAIAAAVAGPSAGEPTVVGNRVALRLGHESPAFDPD